MDAQGDLFSGSGFSVDTPRPHPNLPPCESLDDRSLVNELETAAMRRAVEICAEIGRRRLEAGLPALEALCRRFTGFGLERAIPEQTAALNALAMLGGSTAAAALARLITQGVLQGPGLLRAMSAAAELGSALSAETLLRLLRHDDAGIRAAAGRCVRPLASQDLPVALMRLLEDLHADVRDEAAMALARLGRMEARATLLDLLQRRPSAEIIEALVPIADEDCVILLGQLARRNTALRSSVLAALEAIDHPRAAAVLAALGHVTG